MGAPALAEARCLEAGLGVPGPQEQRSRSKALQMQSLSERVHNVQAGPADWFCEVTTAQCTDCQCKEIKRFGQAWVNGRSDYDTLEVAECLAD